MASPSGEEFAIAALRTTGAAPVPRLPVQQDWTPELGKDQALMVDLESGVQRVHISTPKTLQSVFQNLANKPPLPLSAKPADKPPAGPSKVSLLFSCLGCLLSARYAFVSKLSRASSIVTCCLCRLPCQLCQQQQQQQQPPRH